MDDIERNLKVKIGTKTYKAAPLNDGQLVAIQLIKSIPTERILSVIGAVLRSALGDERYTDLVLELGSSELSIQDLMAGMTELAKATGDAKQEAEKPARKGQSKDPSTVGELPGEGN